MSQTFFFLKEFDGFSWKHELPSWRFLLAKVASAIHFSDIEDRVTLTFLPNSKPNSLYFLSVILLLFPTQLRQTVNPFPRVVGLFKCAKQYQHFKSAILSIFMLLMPTVWLELPMLLECLPTASSKCSLQPSSAAFVHLR